MECIRLKLSVCYSLPLLILSALLCCRGNQQSQQHEKQILFQLDSQSGIPIILGEKTNANLIERNHTMVSLCNRVQKKDREHCILSIHTIFENMYTARYLDFIQDIDLFIKKEVIKKVGEIHEGFVFGGSDMYHNSLQFKQKIMHKVVLEHSKIRQSNKDTNPNLDKLHFCETGFNVGHSALFWLLYDNRINVVSFDIDSSEYTLAARNFLEIHFPNRFHLILGDTTFTLPKFIHEESAVQCDLWLVDGGNSYSVKVSDLSNAIATSNHYLINAKETYIIFENIHEKDVNHIWKGAISQGAIKNPTYIDDSFMPCVEINPSNFEVLPCPECEEINASEKYPDMCHGANLKHRDIRIGAGVAVQFFSTSTMYKNYCYEGTHGRIPYFHYLNPHSCKFFNASLQMKKAKLNIDFQPFVDLPIGLQDSSGGIMQNKLINIGGFCGGGYPYCCAKRGFYKTTNAIDLLNGNKWEELEDFPGEKRAGFRCAYAKGELYCWGGYSYEPAPEDMSLSTMQKTPKKNPYSYVDGYKLNKNFHWEIIPPLPEHMGVFSGMCYHEKSDSIYLIGGADYDKTQFHFAHGSHAWRFSLKTYRWTPIKDFPGSPRFLTSLACLDYIYVLGGNSGGQSVVGQGTTYKTIIDNWKLDVQTMTWIQIKPTPYNLCNFGNAVVYKQFIILIGGAGYSEIFNHTNLKDMTFPTGRGFNKFATTAVLVYNTEKDEFFLSNELPIGINHPFVTIHNDTIYVVGGESNTGCAFGKLYGQHPKLVLKGKILFL